MLPLGHIATALVASDLVEGDSLAAVISSQIPDLIDKPLAWVFRSTDSSRFLAHTAVAVAVSGAVASLAGRSIMRGTIAGHASHLVADQLFGGKVPVFWPLKRYALGHKRFRLKLRPLVMELVAAGYLYQRWSRPR